MHPNELSNKCYVVFYKTCDTIMSDEMYHAVRPSLSLESSNEEISAACLDLMWLRAGRPNQDQWSYASKIGYSTLVLSLFDALPEDVRLDASKSSGHMGIVSA